MASALTDSRSTKPSTTLPKKKYNMIRQIKSSQRHSGKSLRQWPQGAYEDDLMLAILGYEMKSQYTLKKPNLCRARVPQLKSHLNMLWIL